MKKLIESKYNYTTYFEENVICLNGISKQMLMFKSSEYEHIFKNLILKDNFTKAYPSLSLKLLELGFLIENDYEELDNIRFRHNLDIFSSNIYWLTINPTLDCNLNCWYCDINKTNRHIGKSMNGTIKGRIKLFIDKLIYEKKVAGIHLDWFGGEPMLYFNEVIKPLSVYAQKAAIRNELSFSNHITTNGLIISKSSLDSFREIGLNSFQITLDGCEEKHNKIRALAGKSSFKEIVQNINAIGDNISDARITLRINYDKTTLSNISSLVDKFSKKSKEKILIDFQRVWQVGRVEADENLLLKNAINLFSESGFKISTYGFKIGKTHACYSDRYNHIAINYDGKVYKCTARGYNEENSIGYLDNQGELIIKNKKLYNMWFASNNIENKYCLNCSFLPLCMGICSQKKVDIRQGKLLFKNACLKETSEINIDTFLINEAKKRMIIN